MHALYLVSFQPGDLHISRNDEIEKQILSNKLRLLYSRRPCKNCREPDPPLADFPRNWPGLVDLLHIDFKVPSEHTIYGEQFDGEMQMYYIHPKRRRVPVVSVVIRASESGHNSELQVALDYFQETYDNDKALCAEKSQLNRKLVSDAHEVLGDNVKSDFHDYQSWGDFSTIFDDPEYHKKKRKLQDRKIWNPHNSEMVPGVYFFGYEGSLTEPPCTEFVSWFVHDKPMNISFKQLRQIRTLIFTHVSPDCESTSTQYRESVARPIQDSADRPVWRCTSDDWPADVDRKKKTEKVEVGTVVIRGQP